MFVEYLHSQHANVWRSESEGNTFKELKLKEQAELEILRQQNTRNKPKPSVTNQEPTKTTHDKAGSYLQCLSVTIKRHCK